jgi:hypothetical protein
MLHVMSRPPRPSSCRRSAESSIITGPYGRASQHCPQPRVNFLLLANSPRQFSSPIHLLADQASRPRATQPPFGLGPANSPRLSLRHIIQNKKFLIKTKQTYGRSRPGQGVKLSPPPYPLYVMAPYVERIHQRRRRMA